MQKTKVKIIYYILLLFAFCFSNVILGGAAVSSDTVYLHKNHVHIYKYDEINELDDFNRDDCDCVVTFDLLSLKPSNPSDIESLVKPKVNILLFHANEISISNKCRISCVSLLMLDSKSHSDTKRFLSKSVYLI